MRDRSAPHSVTALLYDGLCTFEFGIVVEIFALPRPELDVGWYRFTTCSVDQGPLRSSGGVKVVADGGLGRLRRTDTIVIPGWRDPMERPPEPLLAALRRAHDRGVRLVSICSGVFVLAAAGLLDGKRATTHWRYVEILEASYPEIRVAPDVLYVDEGNVLTSAGSAAGIDLCLHLVRLDYGAEIANRVARRLVVPPHRDGGQSQYVQTPIRRIGEAGLSRVMEWALARLDRPIRIGDLASRANMSERTFARRFVAETGTTPHRWLCEQRLAAAQRQLETTDASVDEVALAAGFNTAETLRHHFRQAFGTSPTSYRKRFAEKNESES